MIFIDLSKFAMQSPSFYLGIEEYYLKECRDDILILWQPIPSIIIGRHQILHKEVDINYANENHISLNRRQSGGGAVFADQNNLMFTFITKYQKKEDIFYDNLRYIIEVFKKSNIDITFSGRNDLLYKDKKISGSAFYYYGSRALLHGTLMFNVDIPTLVKVLSPNKDKLIAKGIESVKQRVININEFSSLTVNEFIKELINVTNCTTYLFKDEDLDKVQPYIDKLQSKNWLHRNLWEYEIKCHKRFKSGNYLLNIEIKNNKISKMGLSGDFFSLKDIQSLLKSLYNIEYDKTSLKEAIDKLEVNEYIKDLSKEKFLELILGG